MLIYLLSLPTNRRELNVKMLEGTYNREKALVGAFYVIVKTSPINRLQLYRCHCPDSFDK